MEENSLKKHTAWTQKASLLLVYSNKDSIESIFEVLQKYNFNQIDTAESSQDAILKLRTKSYDCIITDIKLQDMDGWRLSRLIRSGMLGVNASIPIIVASKTFSYRIAEATAKEFEINSFISLNRIELLPETLHNVLSEQQGPIRSKLLIIEDTPETVDLIKRFLDQRYDIDVASDGATGFEMWKNGKYDLVLLDVMLPEKSGSDVLKLIMKQNPHQSVVMMTAHGSSSKASELMLNGASDFISKPFRARQLRRVCDIALHREDYLISQGQMNSAIADLRNSETRYRRLVESLSEEHFFYTQNTDGTFSYLSPSIKNVLGYSVEDFSNNYISFITENARNSDSLKFHRSSLQGNAQPPFEIEIRHKNGALCQLEITETPIINDNGDVIAVDGIAHNITSRTEAHNQIKTLANATFEGIVIHDHGTIIEINRTIEEIFNVNRFDLIGMDMERLIAKQQHNKVINKLKNSNENIIEAYGLNSDGSNFPIALRSRQIQFNGRLVDVIAIRDMTEQKKAEKEKEAIQKHLRQSQKMESIGHLTGGIAHDFNNILASIQGYNGLALELYAKDGKLHQYLAEVSKASERAKNLISQMLAFSRGGTTDHKPLSLNPLIKEAIKMLRSTLPSSIAIKENYTKKSPTILLDSTQFHQVIMNMCINARDAIEDENGIIELTINKVSSKNNICSSCHKAINGDFINLTIRDNGTGMDDEIISKIFDPFYTTKSVDKGTGMGLSVVHGIMHDHNGHIQVKSELGKGTEFSLYFPLYHGNIEELVSSKPLAIQHGKGKIMVVDDDPALATYLKEMLSSRGYSVELFLDPCEALSAFERNPATFDLILTDQTMPILPGHKLAQAILDKRPDLPVILCTGYSEVIDEPKSKKLNIKGYLQKPVESNKLVELMNDLMTSKASTDTQTTLH